MDDSQKYVSTGWNTSTIGDINVRTTGEKRPIIAAEWYRRAASQGHVRAMYALACMYEKVMIVFCFSMWNMPTCIHEKFVMNYVLGICMLVKKYVAIFVSAI